MSISHALADAFIERANTLGLKGKKRDEAVLEFFCGAATALEKMGHVAEAQRIGMVCAMILSVRGYLGLIDIVKRPEAA